MNKKLLVFLIIVLNVGPIIRSLHAEVRPWKIDEEHTNLYFSVDHIYAKVQGRFTDYRGTLRFDPDNLKDSTISFEIKVKSVDTGIGKRDRHLRSADFFDESKYPFMTFTSQSITKAEENIYNVSGILTIKDVSKELVLPLTFEGMRENPLAPDMEVAGFNGRLTLDRLAYNVGDGKYYQMGAVGKDVDILVTIEALRKK
ncbi:YceI family protein [Desulfopila sp. IMCC35006]|uniref:YceI family protein n=1 Tax=Desulfopila sp. IMCC35006 TaxID=2569542 RepID=UPI0010AC1646|nr:YceI family protein [Desulfopila sp. IMCC35006]TKB27650.1 YceI family protein [Desulfopila sp. IMCC35006]